MIHRRRHCELAAVEARLAPAEAALVRLHLDEQLGAVADANWEWPCIANAHAATGLTFIKPVVYAPTDLPVKPSSLDTEG